MKIPPMTTAKRGRPLKFGRPARAVAVTIPEDVIDILRTTDADLGRAIVALVRERTGQQAPRDMPDTGLVAEAASAGRRHSLIVVDPKVFPPLPGCSLLRISEDRAIITLRPGTGLADLELQVVDRLAEIHGAAPEREGLLALRRALKGWRTDQRITVLERSIIVLESATPTGRA